MLGLTRCPKVLQLGERCDTCEVLQQLQKKCNAISEFDQVTTIVALYNIL